MYCHVRAIPTLESTDSMIKLHVMLQYLDITTSIPISLYKQAQQKQEGTYVSRTIPTSFQL